MLKFTQVRESDDTSVEITLSEDSDIFKVFEEFTSFLKAVTYSNSVIYHGLVNAVDEMEEVMQCDVGTYKEEILKEASSEDCNPPRFAD